MVFDATNDVDLIGYCNVPCTHRSCSFDHPFEREGSSGDHLDLYLATRWCRRVDVGAQNQEGRNLKTSSSALRDS